LPYSPFRSRPSWWWVPAGDGGSVTNREREVRASRPDADGSPELPIGTPSQVTVTAYSGRSTSNAIGSASETTSRSASTRASDGMPWLMNSPGSSIVAS
jgi:hypothetical protein